MIDIVQKKDDQWKQPSALSGSVCKNRRLTDKYNYCEKSEKSIRWKCAFLRLVCMSECSNLRTSHEFSCVRQRVQRSTEIDGALTRSRVARAPPRRSTPFVRAIVPARSHGLDLDAARGFPIGRPSASRARSAPRRRSPRGRQTTPHVL